MVIEQLAGFPKVLSSHLQYICICIILTTLRVDEVKYEADFTM